MNTPATRTSAEELGSPLSGRRVVLTRPRAQAGDFEARVRALGGEPVIAPALAIALPESWTAVDAALRRIETYDWIAFTSANAARMLVERADAIGVARAAMRSRRLATVGPATAAALGSVLRAPDLVATEHNAEALAGELADVEHQRVLFPAGELAGDELPRELRRRGAFVDQVIAYRTVPGDGVAAVVEGVRAGTVDAVLFTSASAVRFTAEALAAAAPGEDAVGAVRRLSRGVAVACIGPMTADAARAAGFEPVAVAATATQDELIDRVAQWFAARRGGSEGGTT